jgi:3-hydroxybutyryl-CoA dehydratase
MATRVEIDLAVGQALPPLAKDVSQRRIDVYSGVKPHSIHSDEAWARQKGFRACLAQGMMSTAYVAQLMVKLLGPDFARSGTMSMAFVKPVYAGDRLTVHGIIKDKQPDQGATRVVVEVWVENQHGEKTAVGHATGLVP